MKLIVSHLFKNYFEVLAFAGGLLLLVFMNPHTANGPTLCLFEQLGFSFCPGEGLGHSIAFIFRGEIYKSIETNFLGIFAIIILTARIFQLLIGNQLLTITKRHNYGPND